MHSISRHVPVGIRKHIYNEVKLRLTIKLSRNGSPWFDIPCWALLPSPGEFFPMTGEDIGGPETGVPGLEPMGRGEFISPPPGLDIGNDVAGDIGLGLTPGPGCCLPAG